MAAPTIIRSVGSGTTGTTITLSTLLVDGTNTLLMLTPGCGANTTRDIVTVTHNGDACTELAASAGAIFIKSELWYRIAPDAGTFDIVFTKDGATGGDVIAGGATLLNGVHQSDTFGTPTTAEAATTANTIDVASTTNQVVISSTATDDETGITAGDTQLWNSGIINSDCSFGGMSQVGAATVTMNWTQDITGWSSCGVGIKGLNDDPTPPHVKFRNSGLRPYPFCPGHAR